jgi:hypothetical protein
MEFINKAKKLGSFKLVDVVEHASTAYKCRGPLRSPICMYDFTTAHIVNESFVMSLPDNAMFPSLDQNDETPGQVN